MFVRGKKVSKPKAENIRNPFILQQKEFKNRIIRDIWTLFEKEEEKKKEIREKKKSIIDH